jgi:MSHA pilin protein MshA
MPARSLSGFTLIELIVVIAILAILSAVAIPRFIDLRTEAVNGAASGFAGALASGTAINYAASLANTARATIILSCGQSVRALQGGVTPVGLGFVAAAQTVAVGASTACAISYTSNGVSGTATANIIGAST